MGGMNLDPLPRLGFHPAAENPAAGKDERVRARAVDDRKFEIAVERGCRCGLPVAHDAYDRTTPAGALIQIMDRVLVASRQVVELDRR